MEDVALVTGCSSGIGLETAISLAREGHFTYATMRNMKKSEDLDKIVHDEDLPIKILELDVDDEESVDNTIAKIMEEKGRIDTLVNNAGWGMWGTVEDVSIEEFKQQFETNFFSIIRMIQKVAPIMRKQKSGKLGVDDNPTAFFSGLRATVNKQSAGDTSKAEWIVKKLVENIKKILN